MSLLEEAQRYYDEGNYELAAISLKAYKPIGIIKEEIILCKKIGMKMEDEGEHGIAMELYKKFGLLNDVERLEKIVEGLKVISTGERRIRNDIVTHLREQSDVNKRLEELREKLNKKAI